MKTAFAPLTAEAFVAVAGTPPPFTCRGFSILDGDRPVLVAGVFPDENRHILFSHFAPEFREKLGTFGARRAIALGIRRTVALLGSIRGAIDANAEAYSGSETLLIHLGFRRVHGSIYRFERGA